MNQGQSVQTAEGVSGNTASTPSAGQQTGQSPVGTSDPPVGESKTVQTQTQATPNAGGESIIQPAVKEEPKVESESIIDPNKKEQVKKEDSGEDSKHSGAPDIYNKFNVPEGFTVSDTDMNSLSETFKGMNLSQENAQKLIDQYVSRVKEGQQTQQQKVLDQRMTWRNELRARPDYAEQKSYVDKGVSLLLTDDRDKQLFTGTWLSDHPVFFNLFARAGRLFSEDRQGVSPSSSDTQTPSAAQIRFPINK